MGTGRLISAQKSEAPSSDGLPSIVVLQAHPSSFSPAVKRRANTVHPSDTRTTNDQVETDEEPSTSGEALFQCPEEGCTKAFLRPSSMM